MRSSSRILTAAGAAGALAVIDGGVGSDGIVGGDGRITIGDVR
jgi:hypothetical protein